MNHENLCVNRAALGYFNKKWALCIWVYAQICLLPLFMYNPPSQCMYRQYLVAKLRSFCVKILNLWPKPTNIVVVRSLAKSRGKSIYLWNETLKQSLFCELLEKWDFNYLKKRSNTNQGNSYIKHIVWVNFGNKPQIIYR